MVNLVIHTRNGMEFIHPTLEDCAGVEVARILSGGYIDLFLNFSIAACDIRAVTVVRPA